MASVRINREIFRLAIPSIVANITIPLVGMVATAVVGHIPSTSEFSTAALIGGISVGSMIFDLMYWNFGFLRAGTGGLTAQEFGRGDTRECANLFSRAEGMALASAVFLLAIQWLVVKFALFVLDATPQVEFLAQKYFQVRVWAAPATLSLMSIKGWLIGMQDGVSPMVTDVVVNVLNVILSIFLALGFHSSFLDVDGMGFTGVALATVISQYCGFLTGLVIIAVKYRDIFRGYSFHDAVMSFKGPKVRQFFRTNSDLFVRSLCFIAIYVGFTSISAGFGDVLLATSSIMMQLMMLFSYCTDGFAYAGEALTGRFVGSSDIPMVRSVTRWVFLWSFVVTGLFICSYAFRGDAMVAIFTNDLLVRETAHNYLPWLLLMPVFGCAAFTWDGIFTGATATKPMRNAMLVSTVGFVVLYFLLMLLFNPASHSPIFIPLTGTPVQRADSTGLHLLLAAYIFHLVVRTVYLSCAYFRKIIH